MNKRQRKKSFRKAVYVFPQGRKTKAGIWRKRSTRKEEKYLMEVNYD